MNTITIETLYPLLALLSIFLLLAWSLQKIKQRQLGDSKSIQIHSSISIGPNQRILLIESMGKKLLVGVTNHSVNTLLEIPYSTDSVLHPNNNS